MAMLFLLRRDGFFPRVVLLLVVSVGTDTRTACTSHERNPSLRQPGPRRAGLQAAACYISWALDRV